MKKLETILQKIAAVFFFAMFVFCILQVVFRFILNISAPFTEEFARMGYIWMVFLTLPVLESRDEQLKVTYFFNKFPMTVRKIIYWIMCAAYIVVLGMTAYGAYKYYGMAKTMTFASVTWLLMSYQYIPVFLGCILGILFIVRRAIKYKEFFKIEEAEYKTKEEVKE